MKCKCVVYFLMSVSLKTGFLVRACNLTSPAHDTYRYVEVTRFCCYGKKEVGTGKHSTSWI